MKTTFLLHGGRLRLKDNRNDDYFRRLTRDLKDGDTLLEIPFARHTKEDQLEIFEKEKSWVLAQTDKNIKVVMANRADLIEQIKQSKAVHITGGRSPDLVHDLQQYPEFLSSLSGKIVGGSSAGACLFSAYYWYGEQGEVVEGLGTLPLALLVHYGSKEFHATNTELDKLKSFAKNLELLTLEEAEWVSRTVNI